VSVINDLTEKRPASTADYSNPTRHVSVDWAGLAVAAGGQVKRVPDYEFSGRTFTRLDRMLNPR
jgi:hypothetical protein